MKVYKKKWGSWDVELLDVVELLDEAVPLEGDGWLDVITPEAVAGELDGVGFVWLPDALDSAAETKAENNRIETRSVRKVA